MRQSPPQLVPPHRCFGAPRACCHSRPVLGSMPLQGWLWLPRSKSELAEFACDVRHSCWSSVETDRSRYDFPPSLAVGGSHLSRRGRAVVGPNMVCTCGMSASCQEQTFICYLRVLAAG